MIKKRGRRGEAGELSIRRVVLGGVLGFSLILLLTFGAAVLINESILSMDRCRAYGLVILAAGGFCASFCGAGRNPKKLVCGFGAAAISFLMVMIIGMIFFSGGILTDRLLLSVGSLALGTIGGVVLAGLIS
ncbi:MAG: TIGR04086 family membrane protein [Clostridia bacterium]|nr:TIGR04086 family membrane protein [Clostridia bacterium]